ncbi:MAG TPA: sigma-70 family RNA polymerase sigma factor [Polyangiaceae bacterium]
MNVPADRFVSKLTDPALAAALSHFVCARLPEPDAEDVVQSTLSEALDADEHPEEDEEVVRWVFGICRHKLADWFRRARREVPRDLQSDDEGLAVAAAESAPQSAMDLLRWAKKELPAGEENEKTLEWMLREGEGEKLETIAAEANVPAPRVRQRVSRLRRYYKAKWAAQAAALAAILLIAIAIALALRQHPEQVAPSPEPSFAPTSMPTPPPSAQLAPPPEEPAWSTQPLVPPAPSAPPSSSVPPVPAPTTSAAPTAVPTSMLDKGRTAPTATFAPPVKPVAKPGKRNPSKAPSFGSDSDPPPAFPASSGDSK